MLMRNNKKDELGQRRQKVLVKTSLFLSILPENNLFSWKLQFSRASKKKKISFLSFFNGKIQPPCFSKTWFKICICWSQKRYIWKETLAVTALWLYIFWSAAKFPSLSLPAPFLFLLYKAVIGMILAVELNVLTTLFFLLIHITQIE